MVANPNTLFPNPDVRPSHQQQPLQLPQHHRPLHPGLLLCCICHEHNTTFRYEVIYKTTAGSISTLALKSPENFLSLQHQQQSRLESPRITELTSEGEEISGHQDSSVSGPDHCRPISKVGTLSLFDDQSHEYYNFPPKYPRHGHLKWPVWTPNPSPVPNGSPVQPCFIATYPDYPIHIPTVTLKRIASARKGKIDISMIDQNKPS